MRVLVAGGAGFIGSHFIKYLVNKYPGYDIINLDRLGYSGNLENLQSIQHLPMYHFVQGDICNEIEVDALMSQGIDAVVNFASEADPDPEENDPARFIRTDVYGTYVLCEAATAYNVDHFLQVSTAAAYGSSEHDKLVRPAYEGDELRPTSANLASRVGAERLAFSYAASGKLPVCVARPTHVFGSHQYPEKIPAAWIIAAMRQEPITLPSSGQLKRDWIHIDDVCRGLDILLHGRRKEVDGEVFNLGSSHLRTDMEVAELIIHFLDQPRELLTISDVAEPGNIQVDVSKLKRLGWEVQRDFHQSLSETIQWYQQQSSWWEKLSQPAAKLPATLASLNDEF